MSSSAARVAAIMGSVLSGLVLGVTAGSARAEPVARSVAAAAPVVVRIQVVGSRPKGGIVRPKVKKGRLVTIVVRSDTTDELHLHGYDISRGVKAGGVARITFRATIQGRFELELEKRGIQIADITVQ